MKTSYFYAIVALFALALVLGCINPSTNNTNNSAAGGGVTVTPTQVVAGGTVTIQYMLQNNYENDMSNVQVSLIGVPSTFSGATTPLSIGTVVSNQQYPAIFTITAPQNTNLKQVITPRLQVCYNYDTNYFFDSALKTTSLATETVTTESGSSSGPVSVSQLGLDDVFVNTQTHVGSLQITNTGSGKIINFSHIKIDKPSNSANINSLTVAYSNCGGTNGVNDLTPSSCTGTTTPILSNTLAISNGLTATLHMTTKAGIDKTLTTVVPERVSGSISYNYCTEIPVGTITVCPAGKAC